MTYVSEMLSGRGTGAIPPAYINLEDRAEIHISDMISFINCRRKWDWSSPLRRHLQPGILAQPLQLGQAVHMGGEWGYRESVGAHRMEFDLKAALEGFYACMDTRREHAIEWSGPLWEDEKADYDKMEKLGAAMLTHYDLWVGPRDKAYKILGTEQQFKVPLPGCRHYCYSGRFDGILEDRHGRLFVLEFKTTSRFNDMSGVLRGMQATMYTWAASVLYERPVSGVVYRIMNKKVPAIPKLLRNGSFSINKKQKMSVEWARYCITKMAEVMAAKQEIPYGEALASLNKAAAPLYGMAGAKENEFFKQVPVPRGSESISGALTAIIHTGQEMTDRNAMVFPLSGRHCAWCQFRSPCDMAEYGDWEGAEDILDAEYAPRAYWEDMP